MLNKFLGIGNLTRDPEVKNLENGKKVGVLSVAINLNKNDKNPLYIDVQVWDAVAENCNKYLSKGRKVFVEGKLNLNSWVSKDGAKKSKIFCKADIVTFLNSETQKPKQENQNQEASSKQDFTEEDEELANIPF
jgi:single-strand DNA-binding protein